VAVAVDEERNARKGRAVLPPGKLDPSAQQIGSATNVHHATEKVDVAADHLRSSDAILQAGLELANPDGDCLPSDEHDLLLADDLLKARDDSLSLVEAQRGSFDLERVTRPVRLRGLPVVAQERERAESKLMRARLGGKAKASVSRLS
jgi:hypothetical protein